MKKFFVALLLLLLSPFGVSHAQQALGGHTSISVTTSSARAAFPADRSQYPMAFIVPGVGAATQEIFYKLGDGTVTAATTDFAVPANGICFNIGPNTNIAAIAGSSTATLRITQMSSCP